MTSDTAIRASGETATRRRDAVEGALLPSLKLSMRAVGGAEFDRLVADFDGVCQEELYCYASRRWPGTSIEPVLFERDGEILGGTLVMLQSMPLRLGAVAVVKWGPMVKDASRPDYDAVYRGMIEALIADYAIRRRLPVSVMPRASVAPVNRAFALLRERGFEVGASLRFPNRYVVRLGVSDDAQRSSLAQKWRYHLTRSEKAGLTFEHAGPERLADFTALYEAMTARKDFADHAAFDTVPALLASPVAALRPELFLVYHGDALVAGALIHKAGDTAVYLYGATNDAALKLRAGYFMQWHIIRWLRDNTRAAWYDLGGTDGFKGLHQFKKGMVGELGVITPVPPVTLYASYPLPLMLGRAAFLVREVVASVARWRERFRYSARPDMKRPSETDTLK